jgi:hypothetical protein
MLVIMWIRSLTFCIAVALAVCFSFTIWWPCLAVADTTYTYTGMPFTEFNVGVPQPGTDSCTNGVGECQLSGFFTVASPVPFNNGFPVFDLTPLSFSFTDGVNTITQSTANAFNFSIAVGPSGSIQEWDIIMSAGQQSGFGGGNLFLSIGHFFGEGFDIDSTDTTNVGGATSHVAGTWITSSPEATPEPSTLFLLGTGLLGLAEVIRRNRPR